jgi:hypothetical protein
VRLAQVAVDYMRRPDPDDVVAALKKKPGSVEIHQSNTK